MQTKKIIFTSLAFGLLLWVSSCKKEPKVAVSWAFFDFPGAYELTSVKIQSDSNWHITGGKTWATGIYANIINQNTIRSLDSIAPKRLNAICLDHNNNIHAVGYTGFLVSRDADTASTWRSNRIFPTLNVLRDVDYIDDTTALVVAGVAYHNGLIFKIGPAHTITQIDSFNLEIRAVDFISNDNAIAVGFGGVLKMRPNGTWERLPILGDFYLDVDFPSPQVGYIIGNAGSILKSTDGGTSWSYLQDKNTYSKHRAFRAVHFVNEQVGFIVGEHGLLWKTTDGGENWKIGAGLPDINFFNIDATENTGIIVGSASTIITFNPDF